MRLAVVGTGYVGLVTGTCFAETGNDVICVDVDQEKLRKLRKGIIPIFEPGLENLFGRNLKEGRLLFTSDLNDAVRKSTVVMLCLPTPQDEDGSADLSYVLKVADDLGRLFKKEPKLGFRIIVDKSTVPVGTSDKVRAAIKKHAPKFNFDVASNPEFLREGLAVEDFMKPERVVIGTRNEKTRKIMEQLYDPFVRSGNPIYFMDEKSAEMTKYAANSFLAMKISFMNEIANLCELAGADVDRVRVSLGSDSRIGKRFLFPGVGYGGSCFPKDVAALINTANEIKYDFKILKAVHDINKKQIDIFVDKIRKHYKNKISGKKFGIWGLAFKPNTDDVREAPAIAIIKKLLAEGASVSAYDPVAKETTHRMLGNKIHYAKHPYEALNDADALIIVTEWNEFRNPDFERIAFKPNTDDVREAPSIAIIKKLLAEGASVSAYDPVAKETTHRMLGNKIRYAKHPYEALNDADALIIVTEWNEFRNPDFERIASLLKQPVIFDGRNLYDVDKMKDMKFTYYSIGRMAVKK